ncbi:MAG: DUF5682 family protein [Pseudomonadota bacterium]
MPAELHYLGIRHHGPGSARQVIAALEEIEPVMVLIEGPSDVSDLLPMLDDKDMQPPVALLTYPKDDPNAARFFPLAEFSPEYQAAVWAARRGVEAHFIDLPASWQAAAPPAEEPPSEEASDLAEGTSDPEPEDLTPVPANLDPIGTLARAAGYSDGESWWRELVEENPEPGPIFSAISDAMTALREDEDDLTEREAAREAHMRLQIARLSKTADGPVAIICGAFHVPALNAKHTQKADRALCKAGPKLNINATWVPWTYPRLAFSSRYGAGVDAPAWCEHLWTVTPDRAVSTWLAKIAAALREKGHIISVASIIEAERLAKTLTAIRGRSTPGFEELEEAVIACLCFGENLLWQSVSREILVGNTVGEIPDTVPLSPLLEDLKRQQKKTRLKPEALERELSLDLRTDSGRGRSVLLHRLNQLDVPWGQLMDAGSSRGTFRERWMLEWKPEYAIDLVEKIVFGASIEQAATGRIKALAGEQPTLTALANLVLSALRAELIEAAESCVNDLGVRASQTSDCLDLLQTLSPLSTILRYGDARETDTTQLAALFDQIAMQAALSIGYAARQLDANASKEMRTAILSADAAMRLVDGNGEVLTGWVTHLTQLIHDEQVSRLLVGASARLLYENDHISLDETALLLERQLSPGTPIPDASGFFEGFFENGGDRLIYDKPLRRAVDEWLLSLGEDTFVENLPLLRRVFSSLDASERSRLIDALFGRSVEAMPGLAPAQNISEIWPAHLMRIGEILTREEQA